MAKLPEIITKTGDKGKTNLHSGERVDKDSPRIILVGKLDTLDTVLGIMRNKLHKMSQIEKYIARIQSDFIYLKGEIATMQPEKLDKRIGQNQIDSLENECADIKSELESQDYQINGWAIYGDEGDLSAYADFARAFCREKELEIIEASKIIDINREILIYLNRLSDYLYWVARLCHK